MKSKLKLTIIVTLVLLTAVFAAACGAASIEGTWKVDKLSGDGIEFSGDQMNALLGGMMPYFVFSSDGNVKMVLVEGQLESSGTYKVDGDKVSITIDGSTQEAKLSGNMMVMNDASTGMEMTLKKS